jgi:hypothetical protein
LQYAKDNNYKIVPICPFVRHYLEKHKEWNDITAPVQKDLFTNSKNSMLDIVIEARDAVISKTVKGETRSSVSSAQDGGSLYFYGSCRASCRSSVRSFHARCFTTSAYRPVHCELCFCGQVTHRDSLGVEQVIRPGEVNWMTAGSGIAHSERFEDPSALQADWR